MAMQTPIINSFNAGEWSPLMRGRTDLEKYHSSCVKMYNFLPTPQGTAVARQGSAYVVNCKNNDSMSALLPFQFSTLQSLVLEFSVNTLRFIDTNGLITYQNANIIFITNNAGYCQITVDSASEMSVGKEIYISGLPNEYGVNGISCTVTSISGTNVVISLPFPTDQTASQVTGTVGSIYEVTTPYSDASKLNTIRYAQKNDILYLFCEGYPVQKVERYGATDWRWSVVDFFDGPYLDINYSNNVCTPSGTGGTVLNDFTFSANSTSSGSTVKYDQTGTATWQTSGSTTMTGYQILLPDNNTYIYESTIYSSKDMEPVSWVLYGSTDNNTWEVIDTQTNFVDYVSSASDWISIYVQKSYTYYKLTVSNTYTSSDIPPNISKILVTSSEDSSTTLNFANTTNINFGNGFTSNDIGRLIRVERSDGIYCPLKITSVSSTTSVSCTVQQYPLADNTSTTYWRLGTFCQTNGYPTCGVFFDERLWMAGCDNYPDTICASLVGSYENMQYNDPRSGTISDSDALNITIESRSSVLWINSDDRGIVLGTSQGEWIIHSSGSDGVITPSSVLARSPSQRGSESGLDVVKIDHQVIYVQRSGRQVNALTYSFEIDGYSSTQLGVQSSHLLNMNITRMAYCDQPYSNIWCLKSDGSLLCLTYMLDQAVQGWSQHNIGGVVESITSIPSPDGQQDTLWMSVKRYINGKTVRFIERMLRPWDFNLSNTDCGYVDCCTVNTDLTQTVKGLSYLAGQTVYGLIDGTTPFGPLTVDSNGSLVLPSKPNIQVVVGIGFEAQLVTQRIEAGSQLGTAQGKTKRINKIIAGLWQTGAGSIGIPGAVNHTLQLTPIQFSANYNMYDSSSTNLHTFDYPINLPPGYDTNGCILFQKNLENTLPLNVTCITYYVDTQDAY